MRAIKGFSRWLWIEKRTNEDVLRNLRLMNAKAHKRRERRSLTTQELTTLVETTETCGKRLCGFVARDRAMLYLIASFTGLRASELASLTVSSFDLENATVTVEAGYSKRRRKDVLPLHPSLVSRLVPWLEKKTKALWPSGWAERMHGGKMIQRDLKRAGIDYVDEQERHADFHALRHTFITSLARSGVHPLKAKELARHSTITLTMDVYSHIETDELRDALGSVPFIDGRRE
jgi:integrase